MVIMERGEVKIVEGEMLVVVVMAGVEGVESGRVVGGNDSGCVGGGCGGDGAEVVNMGVISKVIT